MEACTFTSEELRIRVLVFDNLASRTLGISPVESARRTQYARDAAALWLLADLLGRESQPSTIEVHLSQAESPAFWLVWSDNPNLRRKRFEDSIPTVRHDTREPAVREAERLATANPGVRSYAVPARDFAIAEILPVAWRTVAAEEIDLEIPF